MTTPIDNFDELVARTGAGRLDDLTPEQVAVLEAHLNAAPAAAERLAKVVPAVDPRLSEPGASPSEVEWNRVWEGIASATPARGAAPQTVGRTFHLWRALAAAAACLLLMVVWHRSLSTEPSWRIELSDDVVVHEVEVFGDASAFVAYSEDGSGTAMIWVLEEDEEQGGA